MKIDGKIVRQYRFLRGKSTLALAPRNFDTSRRKKERRSCEISSRNANALTYTRIIPIDNTSLAFVLFALQSVH